MSEFHPAVEKWLAERERESAMAAATLPPEFYKPRPGAHRGCATAATLFIRSGSTEDRLALAMREILSEPPYVGAQDESKADRAARAFYREVQRLLFERGFDAAWQKVLTWDHSSHPIDLWLEAEGPYWADLNPRYK
jgi:hypothetical protein